MVASAGIVSLAVHVVAMSGLSQLLARAPVEATIEPGRMVELEEPERIEPERVEPQMRSEPAPTVAGASSEQPAVFGEEPSPGSRPGPRTDETPARTESRRAGLQPQRKPVQGARACLFKRR